MRPMASTWVASMQNIAAPDRDRLLMWVKCQSLAEPSSAEYWHIGATMMRLASVRSRNLIGVKSVFMRGMSGDGKGWRQENSDCCAIYQAPTRALRHARRAELFAAALLMDVRSLDDIEIRRGFPLHQLV